MEENNKTEKQITIYLEDSGYAHSFKKNESIHSNNFNRVERLIKRQIDSSKNRETKSDFSIEHQYNTISIFGERGSGKTTFILSLLQDISETYKEEAQILGIIDPTQMEEKEHVFLVVLSLINKEVKKRIEHYKATAQGDTNCYEREWDNKLTSLAKGLPTLEKVDTKQYENWNDDWYIVERGLENVTAAYDLEKNFHELVDKALCILKKKFFVLAFDDIDVDMSKGWHILETIRKYLTIPKLVVFLSGNLTLYSYNIRLQIWKQLAELKDHEKHDYASQVNQLEGQYLLKILKPENRIKLMSLLDYSQTYGISYKIKIGEKEEEIKTAYKNILEKTGVHGKTTQQLFINYLLGLSIRSQISILSNHKRKDISNQIDAYISRMMAAGIDVDMVVRSPAFATISIIKYLAENHIFPHSYLLIPNTENHDVNGVLMGLTIIFVNQVKKNPWMILDYMLKVGYTRNLNMSLSTESFNNLLSYSGILQDMSTKNIVALMIAIGKANNLSLPELIPLKGLAIKAKKRKEDNADSFDSILKNEEINTGQKLLSLLPLFSLNKSQKKSTELFYSVLPLLSAVCHIARWGKNDNDIMSCLKDLSLHRTYPMPAEKQGISNVTEEDITKNEELSRILNLNEEDNSLKELVNKIKEWRISIIDENKNKEEFLIPPYLPGRIMTRFVFALKNAIQKNTLAEQMQLHLVIFLNASLVEEAKENNITDINNNNPTNKTKLFYDNLNKINQDRKKWNTFRLTRWLISCPLIYCFIKKDILKNNDIENIDNSLLLYDILKNIKLKKSKENNLNNLDYER